MALVVSWGLMLVSAGVALADPDFYSAWCPCKLHSTCPNYYGRFFDDVLIFGQIPPCKQFDHVRCCSADNIPEGFDLESQVQYFPESVESQREVVQQAIAVREGRPLDLDAISQREDVLDFKAKQEKLKRDIANGIANPNPPCGCYTAGTCPGRYATKSTGRDIGCLAGYETCCFLDDPWPNYQVTNLTISAPCSIAKACARFFGTSPFDISAFGPLEPCYLGQNRCLDFLEEGSSPQPSRVRPQGPKAPAPTPRPAPQPTYRPAPKPTYRPAPQPTYRPAPQPTYRPTPQPTYRPTPQPTYRPTPQPTYRPTPQPTYRPTPQPTYRPTPQPTYRPAPRPTYKPAPRPTYRPAPQPTYAPAPRPRPTYRPTQRPTYQPTTTTYRTTTRKLPETQPDAGGSDNIFNIVGNGAYLPPSREYGSPAERSKNIDIEFALPI